jgi:hypothetical protein
LDVGVDGIFDEIKECLEAGISIAFGGLFVSVCDLGQKGKDFIWGDGFQLLRFSPKGIPCFKIPVISSFPHAAERVFRSERAPIGLGNGTLKSQCPVAGQLAC